MQIKEVGLVNMLTTGRNTRSGGRFNDSTSNTLTKDKWTNFCFKVGCSVKIRPELHKILGIECQAPPLRASRLLHFLPLEMTP